MRRLYQVPTVLYTLVFCNNLVLFFRYLLFHLQQQRLIELIRKEKFSHLCIFLCFFLGKASHFSVRVQCGEFFWGDMYREERVEEALEFAGTHLAERGEEDTQVSQLGG